MSGFSIDSLKQKFKSNNFLMGVELTSSRGKLSESKMQKTIQLGNDVSHINDIDWISITDNAGGHPTLRPTTLGRPFLDKGKDVIVHLTCKDMNRNALESTVWTLASEGFENILALTGDYPQKDYMGGAKPVFDLDSVTLLEMISKMNRGIETGYKKKFILGKTGFFLGAAFSNNKKNENELLPQYSKLLQKLKNGADFIIPQVGFDAKKMQELKFFMSDNGFQDKPLIGNIYLLSKFTSNLFHKNRIPGIVLTDELYLKCMQAANSTDKGKSFFIEFAAKMLSITKGLGYNGAYFGGIHNAGDIIKIIEVEKTFSDNDWKEFVKEIGFSQENEHFLYEKNIDTGLLYREHPIKSGYKPKLSIRNKANNKVSKIVHRILFTPKSLGYKIGKKISDDKKYTNHIPNFIHGIEKWGKKYMYDCQDCGDCALQYTQYICPESQCPKGQRNGPCGGTYNSICEVKNQDCIWARIYDRAKYNKIDKDILSHSPAIKDNSLKGTSGWANYWLEIDFGSKLENKKQ